MPPQSVKRHKLMEIMRPNPDMGHEEACNLYYAAHKEFVSRSLVDQIRSILKGNKPKVTRKQMRVVAFIRDHLDLNVDACCRAYEEKHNESLSRAFYFVCKKMLEDKVPPPSLDTIIKRAKTPRVVEGVRMHQLIIDAGGVEKFEDLLSRLEAFGSLKRARATLESVKEALKPE